MNIKKNLVVNHNNKWVNRFQKDHKVHKIQVHNQEIFNKWDRKLLLLIHHPTNNNQMDQILILDLELQLKEEQLKQIIQL